MRENKKIKKRVLEGIVVSGKMEKTIVVEVKRKFPHPLYKKTITKRKRFKVHDEKKEAKLGDKVKIIEARPYSKEKYFRLLEVLR